MFLLPCDAWECWDEEDLERVLSPSSDMIRAASKVLRSRIVRMSHVVVDFALI